MRNFHPLPPMDETPDDRDLTHGTNTAGEAGVVGAPPHSPWDTPEMAHHCLIMASLKQERYHAHRRAHAEAIGRPYPEERHPVWPR